MAISILSDILKWLLSRRRAQTLDARDSIRALSAELDSLAQLMEDVLEVAGSDGKIRPEGTHDLELRSRSVWNRWCTILDTHAYASLDTGARAEIERCVEIAHAAPGAYIKEVRLVQIALGAGVVPPDVRERFAESIGRLRNLSAKLRLNAVARNPGDHL